MPRRHWVKLWGKELFARAIVGAGLSQMSSAAHRLLLGGRRLLVVSYHRVVEDFAAERSRGIPGLLVSTVTLEQHLRELARRYEIVTLGKALRELGSRAKGSDLAVITFDDGYADVAELGLPVLQRLGMPATVFLPTGFVGTERRRLHDRIFAGLVDLLAPGGDPERLRGENREPLLTLLERGLDSSRIVDVLLAAVPERQLLRIVEDLERVSGRREADLPPGSRLLDWQQVRDLAGSGMDLGTHTIHHRVLPHLTRDELRTELEIPRQTIRERAGVESLDFAYPNGWYNRAVIAEIVATGYRSAVTTEARYNGPGGDPFRIGRFTLWEGSSLGPGGYSQAIASCQLDGTFSAIGIPRVVSGLAPGIHERPVALRDNRTVNTFARPEATHARRDGPVSTGAQPASPRRAGGPPAPSTADPLPS